MLKQNFQNQSADNVAERAQHYLKENDVLLRKHKLVMRLVINFPRKVKTPVLSRIALWLVGKQGGVLDIQFLRTRK